MQSPECFVCLRHETRSGLEKAGQCLTCLAACIELYCSPAQLEHLPLIRLPTRLLNSQLADYGVVCQTGSPVALTGFSWGQELKMSSEWNASPLLQPSTWVATGLTFHVSSCSKPQPLSYTHTHTRVSTKHIAEFWCLAFLYICLTHDQRPFGHKSYDMLGGDARC